MSESVMETDEFGSKRWKNSTGLYHRTNWPAIEHVSGHKAWYINGKLHRLNGPAIEYESGLKYWYVDGEWLGSDDEGFWGLWDILTPEQKKDPTLLSYLPGGFCV